MTPLTSPDLAGLGWNERFHAILASEAPGLEAARVLTEERGLYVVAGESGERPASPSGRLRHDAELDPTATWPAVGDWVALEPARVEVRVHRGHHEDDVDVRGQDLGREPPVARRASGHGTSP